METNIKILVQRQWHRHLTYMLLYYNTLTILLLLTIGPCESIDFMQQYPQTFPIVQTPARPKFTVQPVDQETDLMGRAQFKCAGEASPRPMLFWYKEGHRQLLFPPASQGQTNPLQTMMGMHQSQWPMAAALVSSSSYGSSSDTSPASNSLFTIGSDQLASSYNSNYFGNRIYVDNQGSLNIVNATSSDNGYYACALLSSVGSVLAKAKLTIRNSPNHFATSDFFTQDSLARASGLSSISGKYDLLPPPVIKMGSTNQTLPINTSTQLYCEVVSQVAYIIKWFINGQPLQEDPPRVTVLDNGALQLNELRETDSGVYTCVVTVANDPNMPLASPHEQLDTSMLTTAPPIQQSTTHSCYLRVANPINPNIQFYRMENLAAYPSSPGTPYLISTNGNDAITIGWSPPSEQGLLPIKQYYVEHYDTSQEHAGWKLIHKLNAKESLLIDGLSPEGSHFFVIRATNSRGIGPSSAIAGPMRTTAGENRYQQENQRRNPSGNEDPTDIRPEANFVRDRLMSIATTLTNLTPVGPNSVRLQWTNQMANNGTDHLGFPAVGLNSVRDVLEGYSIRYRAVGTGESSLVKDPLAGSSSSLINQNPYSLPLVTTYVDSNEEADGPPRKKRDITSFDYTHEFNEVRVADHNTEYYTINGLRPFTKYQFFVVPYYKDIDGVPSNILSAQTNEDRPSIGPGNTVLRPINNTAIQLLWLHIPPNFANGILKGYSIRLNRSDLISGGVHGSSDQQTSFQSSTSAPRVLNLPMSSLTLIPLTSYNTRFVQQYVISWNITNLTYKSFYSVQVAGATGVGLGPWSEPVNFVMDHKMLSDQTRDSGNKDFDDVVSKSRISDEPQPYGGGPSSSQSYSSVYYILPVILIIISILFIVGFLLYRRNNQKVITWKKTISEHFTNKFYMPSAVDHHHHQRGGPNHSIQQNIYDHHQQQHLIYSAGSTHMAQPPAVASQTMWAPNNNNVVGGCLNSSGTGSLSSHGALLPISTDPNAPRTRVNNDQILLMNNNNNKDSVSSRFVRGNNGQLFNQASTDSARSLGPQQQLPSHQIIHHGGDYYSVINNVAEYEELDQQRNNMQIVSSTVADRHQTGSSNSDTSCPSSVTRLLPNQNYNRDLLNRTLIDHQRHEMILQQQINSNGVDNKQPFMTMINGNDAHKFAQQQQQQKTALSPYATTNLMNQMPQQGHIFANNQMSLLDQTRQQQQNFVAHNNNTLDDSSRVFMAHQINGGQQNPVTSFRTLQRGPVAVQHRATPVMQSPLQHNQIFAQNSDQLQLNNNLSNYGIAQHHSGPNHIMTNITQNPLNDMKPNLYEHVDYIGKASNNNNNNVMNLANQHHQPSNEIISSSTSSGSVRSPSQSEQHGPSKFRRASQAGNNMTENEAHDLRVFSSGSTHVSRSSDSGNERQRFLDNNNHDSQQTGENGHDNVNDVDNEDQAVDETTAFRQNNCPSDTQRTRQLSKRKRQQQRNRLHNNNQKIG